MRAFARRAGDGGRGWPHATDRTARATVLHRLAAASAADPEKSVSLPSSSFGNKHLAKKPIFQDLPLMPQRAGEERWLWLYGQLRAAILDRRLRPAARMPSSRNLAKQHGVSRGTVVAAFDHLRSEGYVEMRVGAGAFVATTIPTIPDEAIAVTKRKVGDTRKQTTRAT